MDVKDADLGFSGLSAARREEFVGCADRRLLLGLKDAAYRTRPSHHPRWSGIWPDGEPTGDRRIDAPAVQARRKRFTIGMFTTRPWASTRRSLAIIALPRTCAHPALLAFAIRDSKSGLANTSRNLVSVGVRGQPHKLAESRQGPPS